MGIRMPGFPKRPDSQQPAEIPDSKFQHPEKHQDPKNQHPWHPKPGVRLNRQEPASVLVTSEDQTLELGICLEFVCWNLEFPFSAFELRRSDLSWMLKNPQNHPIPELIPNSPPCKARHWQLGWPDAVGIYETTSDVWHSGLGPDR